jgi:PAS domain S-box-containing protein
MKKQNASVQGLKTLVESSLLDIHYVEQIADLMHDTAFFVKDAEGRYLMVNQSLVERHGLKNKAQMIGRKPCEVCPGDFGRIPTEQDAQVLRTGRPIIERLELFWRRPNVPVWGLTSKIPMRDKQKRIVGLIGISKDLTTLVSLQDVPNNVVQALSYMENAIAQPIGPSSLARKAGISAARFARIIKRIYGISPMHLITKTRITAASRQLLETDYSIAQIAHECGFADHSAFTRAFRSATGSTPTEFRNFNRSPVK